jgi:hypothetical protein
VVSGQIDLKIGGAKDELAKVFVTPLRKLIPVSDRACRNSKQKRSKKK